MQEEATAGMLSPYRVLDLADETGILAGKILADLGADVIAVEPPEGNSARRLGPFFGAQPHPERGLVWWAYAAGKRGITLNLEAAGGQALLKRLAGEADFLLESVTPGYLNSLGLGFEALQQVNPRLVMVTMTPFGQDGPYSHYQGPDLVGMALSGFMYLTGDPDRPPLRMVEPQFGRNMAASGAAGAMIAHNNRALTGQGQHVDVSGQEAVARTLSHAPAFWDLTKVNLRRQGVSRPGAGGFRGRVTWQCKDGYVNFSLSLGPMGAGTNDLVRWMDEEGLADESLRSLDWTQMDHATLSQELLESVTEPVERFFMTHTKEELYQGALTRRLLLFPVNTPRDILEEPQLLARQFFTQIQHPEEGATFEYPGGFIRSSETPVGPRRRAPLLGEHNREVYVDGLGLDAEEMVALRQAGVI
ncbi:MAG: CoA transferase [Dehalococcoidia bacterium]